MDCLCNEWQNKAKFTGSISITVNADQEPCGSSHLFTVTAAACGIETGIPATRSYGLLDKPWMAPVQMLKMMMIESTYGGFEDKKDFKIVIELQGDRFPNYSLMGLELFEIFCKGKILNTFGCGPVSCFFFFFFRKNVANSVIGAKEQKPSQARHVIK